MARNYNSQNGSNIVEIKKRMTSRRAGFECRLMVGKNQEIQVEFQAKDQSGVWSSNWSQRAGGPADGERVCDSFCVSLCLFNGTPGRPGSQGLPSAPPTPPITVPFKATQHLFPPIKTNNLFCRKSQQLSSAGRGPGWMACNCAPELLLSFIFCRDLFFFSWSSAICG